MNTTGIDHLGLAVRNLGSTRDFFVSVLGWAESGFDQSYPRTSVTNGHCRFTLWQIDDSDTAPSFDRKKFIGLHHVAIQVDTEINLGQIHESVKAAGCNVEFAPELLGKGPRKHFMCNEPGGLRIEFIWNG